MMTLLIPGPKSLGKDIDVYLRPLIDDLEKLRKRNDVKTIDTFTSTEFNMRAMLLWTINNFLLEVVSLGGVVKDRAFNGETKARDPLRKFTNADSFTFLQKRKKSTFLSQSIFREPIEKTEIDILFLAQQKSKPSMCPPRESGPCLSPIVADHPKRPAKHHWLGQPLPDQLPNTTQAHQTALFIDTEGKTCVMDALDAT
nr:hypothetical protein CQW23_21342 [Tanacetum cinerariifolium]